ncbi:MAG TPA: hypothetical protein V6C81_24595 [Planktothrix sp.]|jgi:hypothetical protein
MKSKSGGSNNIVIYSLLAVGVMSAIGAYAWWIFQTPSSTNTKVAPNLQVAAINAPSSESPGSSNARESDDMVRKSIEANPDQTSFAIKESDVTDKGLEALLSLKHLIRLEIEECDNVTDDGVKELGAISTLKALSLHACRNVTSKSMTWLGHLSLVYLDVSETQIDDAGLQDLAKTHTLQVILLNRTRVTDKGLDNLRAFPLLQLYMVRVDGLTGSGCATLAKVVSLQLLDLTGCTHIAVGLDKLATLHLQRLSLKQTDVHDGDIQFLPAMPTLEALDLSGTSITDKIIPMLCKMTKLKQVSVMNCPHVTASAQEALRKALPKAFVQTGTTNNVRKTNELKDQWK